MSIVAHYDPAADLGDTADLPPLTNVDIEIDMCMLTCLAESKYLNIYSSEGVVVQVRATDEVREALRLIFPEEIDSPLDSSAVIVSVENAP